MSEAGALSNMYEKYKDLCQLVDQVLLDINMNRSSKDNPKRVKLVNLLNEIWLKGDLSVDACWGELLLDDVKYNLDSAKKLSSALSEEFEYNENCYRALEELAWLLESKRTKMYAKMRGAGY